MKISPQDRYQDWLKHPSVSESNRKLLKHFTPQEIEDAFFKDIEFGTAGMRGVMGLGPNRINFFTIQKATVAYGLMLRKLYPQALAKGVVIAHDNRQRADEFTNLTSSILNQMGIHTFIFKELIPTPLLSFTVRYLGALGGIMLTASHNPKEYNGYKVYDDQGCQLVPQKIQPMLDILASLPDVLEVTPPTFTPKGQQAIVPQEVEGQYLGLVKGLQLQPDLPKQEFKMIFSPQHGASYRLLPALFQSLGYQLFVVPEQAQPDANFSGTASPNPEEPAAYEVAIRYAMQQQAHLVMVADPDADRVGLAYRNRKGTYSLLNGNQSAALLLDYLLSLRQKQHLLPHHGVMYDTIVSSPMARKIAQHFGVKTETFLTGFKFIGDRIAFYQRHAGPQFLFGYEESYGCLIGDFVRDKDAIQALTLYAEMSLHYFHQGFDLGEALEQLQQTYGYYLDKQYALSLNGLEGATFLTNLMDRIRQTPFKPLGTHKVVQFDDYLHQTRKDAEGHVSQIALPKANVVGLTFKDGCTIIVRPSGTEPKCKFYFLLNGQSNEEVSQRLVTYLQDFSLTYLSEDKVLK